MNNAQNTASASKAIALRAHHLPNLREYAMDGVRAHWDENFGYTTAFARKHDAILENIVRHPELRIRVEETIDDICDCGACPNRTPDCASPSRMALDHKWAERLGVAIRSEHAAADLVKLATRPVVELGEVALKNGERMKIRLVATPAPEYTDRLIHFLDHKPDWVDRKIRQQLNGAYRPACVDKFFVGEIGDQLAGHLWYGYASPGSGIANFGEVYTAPEHRRKGVADELMRFFCEDFNNSPALMALCTAGTVAARIYFRYGFQTVIPGADSGPLMLLNASRKKLAGRNFQECAEDYYRPGQPVTTIPGTIAHRHDIDCVLRFTHILRLGGHHKEFSTKGATLAGRVGPAWLVANYMEACFQQEDGRGLLTVASLPGGKVAGWAFALQGVSPAETGSWTFDFELHPSYQPYAIQLIKDTLRMAADKSMGNLYAWCHALDTTKLSAMKDGGFKEVARIPDYCQINGQRTALLAMRNS